MANADFDLFIAKGSKTSRIFATFFNVLSFLLFMATGQVADIDYKQDRITFTFSSWSSCEPVRVCAIDLKIQFPSPLILPTATGACETHSLMAADCKQYLISLEAVLKS